jgi:hypothetical protein
MMSGLKKLKCLDKFLFYFLLYKFYFSVNQKIFGRQLTSTLISPLMLLEDFEGLDLGSLESRSWQGFHGRSQFILRAVLRARNSGLIFLYSDFIFIPLLFLFKTTYQMCS